MPIFKCFCGSTGCNPFGCRFYTSHEQYNKETAEFWAQWAEAQRRLDAGEQEVSV